MRIKLRELRRLVQTVLNEDPTGASVSADPTDVKGFYPYETERGTDIFSFWYKSPGRAMGTDGDPGRPEDSAEYIGFKTKDTTPEDAAEEAAPPEEEVPEDTEDIEPV